MSAIVPGAFRNATPATNTLREADRAVLPSLTLFRSDGGPLAKEVRLENGQLHKTALAALSRGTAETIPVETAAELARLLDGLGPHQAISTGILRDRSCARIGTRSCLREGEVSRSLEHFHLPAGPGWLLWDYDAKSMPDAVATRMRELGGPVEALCHLWPEVREAARVIRPSSSDGLRAPGLAPVEGGLHGYILVQNVSRSRDILDILHQRAWAEGLGWMSLSTSGAALERSIIDVTVGSPERLIFEAPPVLQPPVTRIPRPTLTQEGCALSAPLLPEETRERARAAQASARQEIRPTAEARRASYAEMRVADQARRLGISAKASRQHVTRLLQTRILADDVLLDMPDGSTARVGDILDAPAQYDRMALPDPVEGLGYGADKATLLLTPRPGHPGDTPCLVSHAHGYRRVYRFARHELAVLSPVHPIPPHGAERAPALAAIRERIADWADLSDRYARARRSAAVGGDSDPIPALGDKEGDRLEGTPEQSSAAEEAVAGARRDSSAECLTGDPAAPVWLISGAQGVGKTAALVGRDGQPGLLHDGTSYVSIMYSIDQAKSAEAFADYIANRPRDRRTPGAIQLRGRAAERPDGKGAMCRIAPQAEAAAKAGADIRKDLCGRCPYADECAYLQQERDLAAMREEKDGVIVFAVHDHATVALPGGLQPDRVVFDERPRDFFHTSHVVPLKAWEQDLLSPLLRSGQRPHAIADRVAELSELVRPLCDAIRFAVADDPEHGLARIRSTAEALLADTSRARRLGCDSMTAAEILRRAAGILHQCRDRSLAQRIGQLLTAPSSQEEGQLDKALAQMIRERAPCHLTSMAGILVAIATELEQNHGPALRAVHQLKLDQQDCLVAEGITPLTMPRDIPVLHLDGTGNGELAQAWFGPRLQHYHHPIERLGTATYIGAHKFSTVSLTGVCPVTGHPRNADRAEDVRDRWRQVFARYPGCYIAMPKQALQVFGDLPGHVVAWFGALRGRNIAERCKTAIVIGRQQPTIRDIERKARALAVALDRPFAPLSNLPGKSYADYPTRREGLRMRDGNAHGIEVAYHPDPTAQLVLRQVRDAEATQALDRIRPHFETKQLIFAGAAIPDVTFDRSTDWRTFKAGGTPLERALERRVLPLAPIELMRAHPDLWPNRQAVQRDAGINDLFEAVQMKHSVLESPYIRDVQVEQPVQLIAYSRPPTGTGRGQRARSFAALVLATEEDVPALFKQWLGEVSISGIKTLRPTALRNAPNQAAARGQPGLTCR
ncbi:MULTISPECIES: ATP-dependent DNA helicase [Limimaricola]|uniref:Uncharacterized protein n=1 Tax=Limimaricola litoreus TaxID=2955316 RepID=A0A9X2FRZ7_9RHOB|nr:MULTISPECIES: hypothetical protein [Limimaricola]MCP1167136.1 hypothetical protein [Limimaricola litoreus]